MDVHVTDALTGMRPIAPTQDMHPPILNCQCMTEGGRVRRWLMHPLMPALSGDQYLAMRPI